MELNTIVSEVGTLVDIRDVSVKQYIYNSDKMIGGTEVCTLVLV